MPADGDPFALLDRLNQLREFVFGFRHADPHADDCSQLIAIISCRKQLTVMNESSLFDSGWTGNDGTEKLRI